MDIVWVPEFAAHPDWLMELTDHFSLDELEQDFLIREVAKGQYECLLSPKKLHSDRSTW
ncbi:hypothetical protein IQ268_07165 [Oculatella sp. LEGE 06141]|uniref:hypothetical protein n=1 Tax=Oculatella sp. LEGE 06141 TaxID=1828648 RepID=UPI0018822CE2|nr:hypothetical protein [Oculatella sp. LEGE 06141]MBE9178366.1 hypothetical protein [Oculatella sp. LEGE 06141]